MQKEKKKSVNFFSKNFRAPFFAMKIMDQPHREACKLNFYWKICGNFFKAQPYKGQKF